MHEQEALVVLGAHQCDVTQLVWLPSEPWGPALYTGGGDGKVTTWLLPGSEEDFSLWSSQGLAAASSDPNDPFTIPAPGSGPEPTLLGAATATSVGGDLAAFEPTF